MKKYLIIKIQSNGYRCGCCRKTWTESYEMEFEDDNAAIAYGKSEDAIGEKADDDYYIEAIYPIGDCIYE